MVCVATRIGHRALTGVPAFANCHSQTHNGTTEYYLIPARFPCLVHRLLFQMEHTVYETKYVPVLR